ncbi:MAG: hypothetical protein BWY96_03026 [Spirochaetes bacterium ADurb.BinA120]|nr:MAG: hypothetical protein BWY96_03026 [Spirochaetes bacterium ADurb.BinA120]
MRRYADEIIDIFHPAIALADNPFGYMLQFNPFAAVHHQPVVVGMDSFEIQILVVQVKVGQTPRYAAVVSPHEERRARKHRPGGIHAWTAKMRHMPLGGKLGAVLVGIVAKQRLAAFGASSVNNPVVARYCPEQEAVDKSPRAWRDRGAPASARPASGDDRRKDLRVGGKEFPRLLGAKPSLDKIQVCFVREGPACKLKGEEIRDGD